MKINLTAAALLQGEPITPGWYKAKITAYKSEQAKSGTSVNHKFTFAIPKLKDQTVDHIFNSQYIAPIGGLIAALRGLTKEQILAEAEAGTLEFDGDDTLGQEVNVKIDNEDFQGRLMNRIQMFLHKDAQLPF